MLSVPALRSPGHHGGDAGGRAPPRSGTEFCKHREGGGDYMRDVIKG